MGDAITLAATHDLRGLRQPRARGTVILSAKRRGDRSVLDGLRQAGSLRLLFPRGARCGLQSVLVNTAGGITGGDRFDVTARAAAGTGLTFTTQTAERAYRAREGETARVRNQLSVADGARLNWLPQETILFDGCALQRTLIVDVAESARLLLVEPLVFGRTAMGERLRTGTFHDRIEIRRNRALLYLDAIAMTGDITAHLARRTVADGAGAMATLIYIAPDAEAHLPQVRALLPASAGASLIRESVLTVRALARDSHTLRQYLVPILIRLNGDALPRPWSL